MPENAGLYQKFDVRRRDGRDQPGGDRGDAVYFVLDVLNDPYAVEALDAYRRHCQEDLPELAAELRRLIDEIADHQLHGDKPGPMVQKLRSPK